MVLHHCPDDRPTYVQNKSDTSWYCNIPIKIDLQCLNINNEFNPELFHRYQQISTAKPKGFCIWIDGMCNKITFDYTEAINNMLIDDYPLEQLLDMNNVWDSNSKTLTVNGSVVKVGVDKVGWNNYKYVNTNRFDTTTDLLDNPNTQFAVEVLRSQFPILPDYLLKYATGAVANRKY